MPQHNGHSQGILNLASRLGRTTLGVVRNRLELLSVEWQEERLRVAELLVWLAGLVFFAIMGALLVTATIIFLFPVGSRLYVSGVLDLLYLAGAVAAWFRVKASLAREPFAETVNEARRDQAWLESFK
jgi:uncharacterized membrane protein YqjE